MIVIVVALALLAAGGFAAASYLRMWAQGSPDATEVAMPVAGPDSGLRRSFYSFGHTSTAIFLQTASPKVVEQRLPFQLGVVPQQFRVRVENIDYLGDERLGDIEIQSVYLGHMTGEGEFETDVRLSGREETRNSKFVTDWFDQETMQLDTDEEYLLGISFSAPAKTKAGIAPGVGWLRQGIENGALVDDKNRGAFNRAGTYLDISIDYTFEGADVPVLAVFGHSLNAGANQNPDVPHKGEVEAWHQLWARKYGGSAASFAAAGAWTANFLADSPKWDRAADVDADYVAIWASSSDLVAGGRGRQLLGGVDRGGEREMARRANRRLHGTTSWCGWRGRAVPTAVERLPSHFTRTDRCTGRHRQTACRPEEPSGAVTGL
jgi:hypothetical protein